MVAALAAFYSAVPVVHVEAGLRTKNRRSPFPEEINRRLTTQLADLHLAPTASAKRNLLAEGIPPESVVVTGNTVIDALLWTATRKCPYTDDRLEQLEARGRRVLLVTAHRRESWGAGLARIAEALRLVAISHGDIDVVVPMHRNPIVRETLVPILKGLPNVLLTEPLDYPEFARLMSRSHLLLTDSGGVQEEGPSLGKPVLVMRDTTERPEAIDAGTAFLVGTDTNTIVGAVSTLLSNREAYTAMANAVNPYGDGMAADRSVHAIELFLGLRKDPVTEFTTERAVA
jgi:UDP-N-acetylglucosamine 2-epimerase (non-hydrolysing)